MNELLYQKNQAVAALNRVEGFEPLEFARTIKQEDQEDQLYLDVKYRKLWFRLANPLPATQVAAKITVMTAHTEDDHKTIFLSSPDSAVGVQWPCVSSASHPDFGTSPPAVEPGEVFQASGSENGLRLHFAAPPKSSVTESPAIPPKMSKNSQQGSEGSCVLPASSPLARLGDGNNHDGAGAHPLPRSCADTGGFGVSPSPCAHINGASVEESGRGLAGLSYDRRQKCSLGFAGSAQKHPELPESLIPSLNPFILTGFFHTPEEG